MSTITDYIKQDVRADEALKACMNCGMCTAVCPAAEFYDYDPRRICDTVQRGDEAEIERLLRSDTLWYCGQCMSCKTRGPRGNVPGELISVLRRLRGIYRDCRSDYQASPAYTPRDKMFMGLVPVSPRLYAFMTRLKKIYFNRTDKKQKAAWHAAA